ncbi:hypothetical protein [Burkholderia pseudomultivorans]|uniref:hypothetical protein n=1 Tax=Burkholderia pseudomultivorans TaxID=1207504 RepID=UPI001890218D|nr:hypothetical protein [Burkholderia pseudomultivorans]MBF5009559.1 hypothetical protein [Burkholderia pseudomultivorans]
MQDIHIDAAAVGRSRGRTMRFTSGNRSPRRSVDRSALFSSKSPARYISRAGRSRDAGFDLTRSRPVAGAVPSGSGASANPLPTASVIERVALRVPFVLHHRLLVEPAHCFRRPPIGTPPLRSALAVCPWRAVAIGLSGGVPFADGFTADAGRKDECGGIDNAWKEVTGQHGGDDVAMECASTLVR